MQYANLVINSELLINIFPLVAGIQPIVTSVATVSAKTHASIRSSESASTVLTPDVAFSGGIGVHRSSLLQDTETAVRNQVHV